MESRSANSSASTAPATATAAAWPARASPARPSVPGPATSVTTPRTAAATGGLEGETSTSAGVGRATGGVEAGIYTSAGEISAPARAAVVTAGAAVAPPAPTSVASRQPDRAVTTAAAATRAATIAGLSSWAGSDGMLAAPELLGAQEAAAAVGVPGAIPAVTKLSSDDSTKAMAAPPRGSACLSGVVTPGSCSESSPGSSSEVWPEVCISTPGCCSKSSCPAQA